ncbi:prolyl oligopeptidase family-domain-containing protein [Syncephalis plumigaleata]|nr:prolyl oligopeptidase family-domain-containing protein [Syncephalis plumigaleata]
MLDVNTLGKAAGRIGSFKTAKNEEMLAFTVDSTGNERYTIYFKNLATMTMLDYTIENVNAQIEWSATGESILYTPVDAKGHAKRIMRHMVGDTRKKDVLVYGDREDITTVKFEKSSSGRYFFIYGGQEKDFKSWTPVLGEINSVDVNTLVFREHLVLFEQAGNIQVKIFPFTNGKLTPGIAPIPIKFPDASYSIDIPTQSVFDSHLVKFGYASLITPLTAFTYDVKSGKRGTITLNEFPGYVRGRYVTTMITAPTAPDANGSSQLIPITIAYRADLKRKDGRNPLWLTGYGSYGIAYTPSFKPEVISLLDRGFIFAIAHVRGGGELNLSWQLQGKQHRKKNSFSDFISVADKLVAEKYTSHDMMVIEGTSAGGMLIGAVLNERPDIAKVAILNVPFLDVLDTMMDPNNPTASTDNYEWGNPITSKEYYNTIKLYSPYDNIKPNKEYPNVLVLAGLNDRRVPYWDPAKWVAKLRATTNARNSNGRKDPRTIVMLADKDAGHNKLQLGMNAQDPSIVMRTS